MPVSARVGDSGVWYLKYHCSFPLGTSEEVCDQTSGDNKYWVTEEVRWSLIADTENTATFRVPLSDGENFDFTIDTAGALTPRAYSLVLDEGLVKVDF